MASLEMEISDEENEICTQDERRMVNEVVKAILVLDHSKKPFKPTDIQKYLSKKPNRKLWNGVLEESKKRLNELGLSLVELKNTSTKSFILVSSVAPLSSMCQFASESEVADRTLLVLVLTFIFMKESVVTNVDILNHLQDLKIYNEKKPIHEYFGDIRKKLFTEFVSQLYLEKIIDKESETFVVKWGERATAEVSKMSILEFVCEIGYKGEIQPKNLASHYKIALEEEKERRKENCGDEVMIVES